MSNNDFIVQLVADLTGLRVERPVDVEMSSLGCAFIVGLQMGKIFYIIKYIESFILLLSRTQCQGTIWSSLS